MRVLLAAVALAALAGCGFKPMYAPTGGGQAIGPVTVSEVPSKTGHALRTELTRLLDAERGDNPRRLEVGVYEVVAPLGLRVDESASRADLITGASYTFYDHDGKVLVRGGAGATVSYDVPGSSFGSASAQDDARERAGVLLAQQIRSDLALRLERLRQTANDPAVLTPPHARQPGQAGPELGSQPRVEVLPPDDADPLTLPSPQ